ncbi:histidine kinase [Pseudoflavitalea sp. X16]|uniref:sensor histidine kinase n=1 Tax=Paraflavitalea devenefica TaxID=2716334 RepID=UPI0014239EF6|nr:histidine kinase [Paraflavitalea devenefica]NII25993.1 histidine kinase [Paraflavitalea devenefica]
MINRYRQCFLCQLYFHPCCWLICFLSCFLSLSTRAQDLSYRQYTIKDGLPGAVVYHSVQDKDGFIWFATNQGVSRFDGRSFKNFTKKDGLPDNDVFKLYIDKHNTIWFISLSGVPAVYYKGVIRSLNCQGVSSISEDKVADSIYLIGRYGKNNEHWYGYYKAANVPGKWDFVNCFRKATYIEGSFNLPVLRASVAETRFYYAVVNRQQSALHIKTTHGYKINLFDHGDLIDLAPFKSRSFVSVIPGKKAIVFYDLNYLYYADSNGIQTLLSLKKIGVNVSRVTDMNYVYCESDSILWLCARDKGLIKVAGFMKPEKICQRFFPNSYCTSILKDAEAGYWITTYEGIYYLPNLNFYTLSDYKDIGTKDVRCIDAFDDQTLIAGFTDGTIAKINHATAKPAILSTWSSQNKYNRVLNIKRRGKEILAVTDGGLYAISPNESYKKIPKAVGIKGFIIESDSSFIIASATGVHKLNPGTEKVIDIYTNRATSITGSHGQYFWGSLQGVFSYTGDSVTGLGKYYPALSGIINYLILSPDTALWVATQQGVAVLKHNVTNVIKEENGLPSNNCRHVLVESNRVWVSTDKGIARINYHWQGEKLVYTVLNITENDGLISDDVNQVAKGGAYIWAATNRGISFFPVSYNGYSMIPPFIAINSVRAGNIMMPSSDTVYLDYHKNNLTVEISGVAFHNARNMHYQYRLNGVDSTWYPAINNTISFSALPYGEYVLEIGAFNKECNLIGAARKMVIINEPPIWKSTWFMVLAYMGSILLVALSFYLYYRRRQRKKEQLYQVNKKVHELEVMALRAQMNPHFIFNCLNSIQHYILQADVVNANLYLHRFSLLIRKILQLSPSSTISLREEIEMLELYLELEQMRLEDRMQYRIKMSGNLNPDDIFIPSMIIQPYVENAIKHGIAPLRDRKGMITVEFSLNGDNLECFIEDNGIGINTALQHKHAGNYQHISMGSNITESRIQAINSIRENKIILHITDRQTMNASTTGTLVQIIFPGQNE